MNPDLNKLAREAARNSDIVHTPEAIEDLAQVILSCLTKATEAVDEQWRERFRKFEKIEDRFGPAKQRESRAAPASAEQQDWQHKIADFVNSILHGDEIHKAWLREAGEAFILDKPLPPPRDGHSALRCVYCGLGAQELKPPHYLKRINRLGDTPSKWICTEHQYVEGEVRHDLLDDSHYFGKPKSAQPQKERTGEK